jgi:16S rRNA (cytosine1402-N4)-methyltransferase
VKYTGGHPAKRIFQAIRIYVNSEIENIEPTLDSIEEMLESGGRLAVISFHSGEDKIVKRCFAKYEKNCVCPPDFPVCACSKKSTSKVLTKKPVYPSTEELEKNPQSESAKLRVLEKI